MSGDANGKPLIVDSDAHMVECDRTWDYLDPSDLVEAGVMSKRTMRVFDEMCLTPVEEMTPEKIRELRLRENTSQVVFTRHLNMTTGLVSRWERREKRPWRFVQAADAGREERRGCGRMTVPAIVVPRRPEHSAPVFESHQGSIS